MKPQPIHTTFKTMERAFKDLGMSFDIVSEALNQTFRETAVQMERAFLNVKVVPRIECRHIIGPCWAGRDIIE